MPRYYFEIGNRHLSRDHDGDLLSDTEAARRMALEILVEVLPLHGGGEPLDKVTVTVLDDRRRQIYRLSTELVPLDQDRSVA